jgi:hypothetical protein
VNDAWYEQRADKLLAAEKESLRNNHKYFAVFMEMLWLTEAPLVTG